MRNLTLEGRLVIVKMLAILEIGFLAFLTKITYRVVKKLDKKYINYFFGKILLRKENMK